MSVKVKITGAQKNELEPLLQDYIASEDVKLSASVLTIVDDNDAVDILANLREGHARHEGTTGAKRALAIAIRKLDELVADALEEPQEEAPADKGDPATYWSPETQETTVLDELDTLPAGEDTETVSTRRVEVPGPLELPTAQAGILRAILEGNHGAAAKDVAKGLTRRDGERATRYIGRLRHAMYLHGAEKVGDKLQLIPA